MARLGDLCRFINGDRGKNYPSQADIRANGEIPFINAGHLVDGKIDFSEMNYISQKKFEQLNSGKIQENDILYCLRGSLGKKAIVKGIHKGAIASSLVIIRPDIQKLNSDYLFYALESPTVQEQMMQANNGSSQPNLSAKSVSDYTFNLPGINEQLGIVSKLTKVNELIALRKEQLAKLDELVKSRFIELFGETGKQVPLTDYVWFQEGPGVRSVDFTEEGTILLTGSNINDNTISFGYKSDRHISNKLASGKYAHFMCDKDDILVVSSAIDPDKFDKKVVVIDVDKEYCLNTGIIRFKPNKQYLTLEYFREFLKTDYFKHQVSSEMRGIAQMHFGPSHLKQMTILLPDSIERQVEFEAFVQQTDKSKLAIQQSLEKLELLKKSLMQEYFG